MTNNEQEMLEKFLQYGDLINANLIFMGYEEGVAKLPTPHDVQISIEARRLLHADLLYKPYRILVNGINDDDGWYIDEQHWDFVKYHVGPLTHAIRAAIAGLGYPIAWTPPTVNVINMQTRLHWLLLPGNRTHNYTPHDEKIYAKYNHRISRHMIDFYPFPKRGKKIGYWDATHHNIHPILSHHTYYNYYNTPSNNRWNIISKLYNLLPMNVTVSYAGKDKGIFLLLNFYKAIGFTSFRLLNTGLINPIYTGPIIGSHTPKDFLIGYRTKKNGQSQIVALTPFFGNGAFGYHDIDALSTWL